MRITIRLLLSVMMVLLSAISTFAQEALWKELDTKFNMLYERGQYSEAVRVAEDALKVAEKTFGPDHPDLAMSLNKLALLYLVQGKYAESEPLQKRALAIFEKALGLDHPDVATVCENLARCYRELGKEKDAEELEARAKKIRSRQ